MWRKCLCDERRFKHFLQISAFNTLFLQQEALNTRFMDIISRTNLKCEIKTDQIFSLVSFASCSLPHILCMGNIDVYSNETKWAFIWPLHAGRRDYNELSQTDCVPFLPPTSQNGASNTRCMDIISRTNLKREIKTDDTKGPDIQLEDSDGLFDLYHTCKLYSNASETLMCIEMKLNEFSFDLCMQLQTERRDYNEPFQTDCVPFLSPTSRK